MFPYSEKLQQNLEKDLVDIFGNPNLGTTSDTIKFLDAVYIKNDYVKYAALFPVMDLDFVYDDDLCEYTVDYSTKYGKVDLNGKTTYKEERLKKYIRIIRNTLAWMKKNSIPVKKSDLPLPGKKMGNFQMFLDITDTPLWGANNLPIFVQAKPADLSLPMFMDWTFFEMTFNERWVGETFSWDETVSKFKELRTLDPGSNSGKFFFRGMDSTDCLGGNRSLIRSELRKSSETDKLGRSVIKVFGPKETVQKFVPLFDDMGHLF